MVQVTICGGGNAAHAMCADLSSRGHRVNMYMPFSDEAARFKAGLKKHGGLRIKYSQTGKTFVAHPACVSTDPKEAFTRSKYVFIPLPVFAHLPTLRDIVPHVAEDAVIVALPATGAFDWTAEKVFAECGRRVHIAGLAPLPYVCRTSVYGSEVELFGVKEIVGMATAPCNLVHEVASDLQNILRFKIDEFPSFLALTLTPTNPIMHTGRMYGMLVASKEGYWRNRVGGFKSNPKFYDDCDDVSDEWLHKLDNENQAIVRKMEELAPGCIAGRVETINKFLQWTYGAQITDSTTCGSCYRTNIAFKGLGSPMYQVATDYWVPDFKSRYFTEDIPCGLLANRGLAELLGVPTPHMDTVIEWAQMEMGRKWLVNGKVNPKELPQTTPQAAGLTKEDVVSMYQVQKGKL